MLIKERKKTSPGGKLAKTKITDLKNEENNLLNKNSKKGPLDIWLQFSSIDKDSDPDFTPDDPNQSRASA